MNNNAPGTERLKTGVSETTAEITSEDGLRYNFKYWYEHGGGMSALKHIRADDKKKALAQAAFKGYMAAWDCEPLQRAVLEDILKRMRLMGIPEEMVDELRVRDQKTRSNRYFKQGNEGVTREDRVGVAIEIMKAALSPNRDEVIAALAKVQGFVPEWKSECLQNVGEGDDRFDDDVPPLMTEAFTYEVFGKDPARTLLAYWGRLLAALGVDEREVWEATEEGEEK